MSQSAPNTSLRPKMITVFVAAFLAGGTAAVGVNRFIDVSRTRSKATVECESIFVALRDLPAGNPVTVWDVKLRDWPKAMVPQAALRPESFEGIAWPEGHVARLSLREGQPVLRSHLQAAVVEVPPAIPRSVASSPPAAVAEVEPAASPESVVATAPAIPASEAPVVADAAGIASAAASTPTHEFGTPPAEQAAAPQAAPLEPSLVSAATSPAPAAPVESSASAFGSALPDQPTPADTATGGGWPSAAETAAGSEAAMRFLVVPERIAIMADELTAPRKPEPPKTPVASVATQPKRSLPAGQQNQPAKPRQITPPERPGTAQSTTSGQPIPRANYADRAPSSTQVGNGGRPKQPVAQPQGRPTPSSPAIRQQPPQASPSKDRPARRTTSAPTPRVAVEPDPESELADEAARTPMLKTMFPNMSAGLEKIESEMTRIRRERFGSLFRSTDRGQGDAEGEADGGEPAAQRLPSPRYR